MHLKRISSLLLAACIVMTASLQVQAKINVQDLHPRDGNPALVMKTSSVYLRGHESGKARGEIPKGTVIRVKDGMLEYNGLQCTIDQDNLLSGNALHSYVVENAKEFDKKVTTACNTKLYDQKTCKPIALVSAGTSFLIKSEDSDFYTVMFEENAALLYKKDATQEIYVKVTTYDDSATTIKEMLQEIKSISESLGIKSNAIAQVDSTIVKYAMQFVGNPYVWGGTSLTDGCDCSGFTQQVYKHFGVNIPRCSYEQVNAGTSVQFDDLQPGDLLFFNRGAKIGHVAMYAGDGMIVHAKSTKCGIVYEQLKEKPVACKRMITDVSS